MHLYFLFLPRNPVHKKLWPPSTLGKVLPGPHKVSVLATLWPVIKQALLAGVGFAGGENIDKLSYMYMSVDVMCMDPPSMAHAEVSRVRIENKGPVQGKDPNPKNSPLQGPYRASRAPDRVFAFL